MSWLRWYDPGGNWVVTSVEEKTQQLDKERIKLDQKTQQLEQERIKTEKLIAQLKSLGIEPDV
jgi:cell division protein FtsB